MGAQLRVVRRRIKTVQATKKITRAMELIAASRIVKAQQRLNATLPYTAELNRALTAAASNSSSIGDHPLTSAQAQRERAAMLVITADRGLAGAYSSNAIREAQALTHLLSDEGVNVVPYVVGRKGEGWFRFRGREVARSWTGVSDQPTYAAASEIADAVLARFLQPTDEGGADEIHIIYTHFANMVSQEVRVRRILPLQVVEEREERYGCRAVSGSGVRLRAVRRGGARCAIAEVRPHHRLLRNVGVGCIRARCTSSRHEGRDRQRRRAHQDLDPPGQRRPSGGDHPRDQRNRRWRRRAVVCNVRE